jgi:hypothetical protein
MSIRCIPIALACVLIGASGVDAPVGAAEQGCGTLYDTWRDVGEPTVRQYDHGADTPYGWNTQIGVASMSQAHNHVEGSQTLDHTWGFGTGHDIC